MRVNCIYKNAHKSEFMIKANYFYVSQNIWDILPHTYKITVYLKFNWLPGILSGIPIW